MTQQQRGAGAAARVLFIVPRAGKLSHDSEGNEQREDKFVELGVAWLTQQGSYRFQLDAVPLRMLAGDSVTFVLVPIKEDEQQSSSSAKPGNTQQSRGRR